MSSLSAYTDAELILLLRDESEAAFTELYQRHWQTVYRNAMRLLQSSADAEDVVQQVFESIWKRRQQIEIQTTFEGYIFSVARYIAISIVEKNTDRYSGVRSLSEKLEKVVDPAIESELDAERLEIAINQIVDTLPPKMRDIFLLSRRESLTHKQIAEKLQVSEETVKKQVHYALKILRERLGDAILLWLVLETLIFSSK
jgi:RNA polymerase sigma-70 factor (ECF subfamily)